MVVCPNRQCRVSVFRSLDPESGLGLLQRIGDGEYPGGSTQICPYNRQQLAATRARGQSKLDQPPVASTFRAQRTDLIRHERSRFLGFDGEQFHPEHRIDRLKRAYLMNNLMSWTICSDSNDARGA